MRKQWLWAGIDLGVETASVCVINDAGEILYEAACPSTAKAVRRQLTKFRRSRYASVAAEAGTATHVARGLRDWGYPVELYQARQLSKFLRARRNKTDAGDAIGIAEAGRIAASIVSKVHLKSLDSQALQSQLAVRRHLMRQRIAAVNMLGRQLELFGGRLHCKPLGGNLRDLVDGEIRKLFGSDPSPLVDQLHYLCAHCERLIAYQRAMDLNLKRVALDNPICRRFMEIPGVGPLCALNFLAVVDDPHRFARSSKVGSYLGLAPMLRESGLTVKKSRISKMGNTSARCLLVQAARVHMRRGMPETALRSWTLGIEARRGLAVSRVALARKLAVVMLAMWKSGGHFDQDGAAPGPRWAHGGG